MTKLYSLIYYPTLFSTRKYSIVKLAFKFQKIYIKSSRFFSIVILKNKNFNSFSKTSFFTLLKSPHVNKRAQQTFQNNISKGFLVSSYIQVINNQDIFKKVILKKNQSNSSISNSSGLIRELVKLN